MQLESIQKLCLCIHALIMILTTIWQKFSVTVPLWTLDWYTSNISLRWAECSARLLSCLHTRFCCFFPKILDGQRGKNTRKWLEIPSSLIEQWNDNPRQGTEVLLEFCGIKYFSWISRSVWSLMNTHFAIFVINIQRAGRGLGMTGGYNPPRLPHLLAFFRLRNISIVACCVILSYSSRFSSFQNPTSRPLSSCIPKPSRPYSLFPRPLTPVLHPPSPPTTRSFSYYTVWKRWAKAISIILSKVLGAAFDQ